MRALAGRRADSRFPASVTIDFTVPASPPICQVFQAMATRPPVSESHPARFTADSKPPIPQKTKIHNSKRWRVGASLNPKNALGPDQRSNEESLGPVGLPLPKFPCAPFRTGQMPERVRKQLIKGVSPLFTKSSSSCWREMVATEKSKTQTQNTSRVPWPSDPPPVPNLKSVFAQTLLEQDRLRERQRAQLDSRLSSFKIKSNNNPTKVQIRKLMKANLGDSEPLLAFLNASRDPAQFDQAQWLNELGRLKSLHKTMSLEEQMRQTPAFPRTSPDRFDQSFQAILNFAQEACPKNALDAKPSARSCSSHRMSRDPNATALSWSQRRSGRRDTFLTQFSNNEKNLRGVKNVSKQSLFSSVAFQMFRKVPKSQLEQASASIEQAIAAGAQSHRGKGSSALDHLALQLDNAKTLNTYAAYSLKSLFEELNPIDSAYGTMVTNAGILSSLAGEATLFLLEEFVRFAGRQLAAAAKQHEAECQAKEALLQKAAEQSNEKIELLLAEYKTLQWEFGNLQVRHGESRRKIAALQNDLRSSRGKVCRLVPGQNMDSSENSRAQHLREESEQLAEEPIKSRSVAQLLESLKQIDSAYNLGSQSKNIRCTDNDASTAPSEIPRGGVKVASKSGFYPVGQQGVGSIVIPEKENSRVNSISKSLCFFRKDSENGIAPDSQQQKTTASGANSKTQVTSVIQIQIYEAGPDPSPPLFNPKSELISALGTVTGGVVQDFSPTFAGPDSSFVPTPINSKSLTENSKKRGSGSPLESLQMLKRLLDFHQKLKNCQTAPHFSDFEPQFVKFEEFFVGLQAEDWPENSSVHWVVQVAGSQLGQIQADFFPHLAPRQSTSEESISQTASGFRGDYRPAPQQINWTIKVNPILTNSSTFEAYLDKGGSQNIREELSASFERSLAPPEAEQLSAELEPGSMRRPNGTPTTHGSPKRALVRAPTENAERPRGRTLSRANSLRKPSFMFTEKISLPLAVHRTDARTSEARPSALQKSKSLICKTSLINKMERILEQILTGTLEADAHGRPSTLLTPEKTQKEIGEFYDGFLRSSGKVPESLCALVVTQLKLRYPFERQITKKFTKIVHSAFSHRHKNDALRLFCRLIGLDGYLDPTCLSVYLDLLVVLRGQHLEAYRSLPKIPVTLFLEILACLTPCHPKTIQQIDQAIEPLHYKDKGKSFVELESAMLEAVDCLHQLIQKSDNIFYRNAFSLRVRGVTFESFEMLVRVFEPDYFLKHRVELSEIYLRYSGSQAVLDAEGFSELAEGLGILGEGSKTRLQGARPTPGLARNIEDLRANWKVIKRVLLGFVACHPSDLAADMVFKVNKMMTHYEPGMADDVWVCFRLLEREVEVAATNDFIRRHFLPPELGIASAFHQL